MGKADSKKPGKKRVGKHRPALFVAVDALKKIRQMGYDSQAGACAMHTVLGCVRVAEEAIRVCESLTRD